MLNEPTARGCPIRTNFNSKQQAFLDFVLFRYVEVGVEELDHGEALALAAAEYSIRTRRP